MINEICQVWSKLSLIACKLEVPCICILYVKPVPLQPDFDCNSDWLISSNIITGYLV